MSATTSCTSAAREREARPSSSNRVSVNHQLRWHGFRPTFAKVTRVCVYDRAGRGWSEAANEPEDGVQTATDLHTLLHRAAEQGPFVLAGHSAGGIYALNFARRYPGEVAGMVLLDSMHPEQYTRIADWKTFYETFRRASAVMPVLNRLGVGRVLYRNAYDGLPAVARDEQRAFWSTPRHWRSVRDEFSELRTAMTQAKHTTLVTARSSLSLRRRTRRRLDGSTGPAHDALDEQHSPRTPRNAFRTR